MAHVACHAGGPAATHVRHGARRRLCRHHAHPEHIRRQLRRSTRATSKALAVCVAALLQAVLLAVRTEASTPATGGGDASAGAFADVLASIWGSPWLVADARGLQAAHGDGPPPAGPSRDGPRGAFSVAARVGGASRDQRQNASAFCDFSHALSLQEDPAVMSCLRAAMALPDELDGDQLTGSKGSEAGVAAEGSTQWVSGDAPRGRHMPRGSHGWHPRPEQRTKRADALGSCAAKWRDGPVFRRGAGSNWLAATEFDAMAAADYLMTHGKGGTATLGDGIKVITDGQYAFGRRYDPGDGRGDTVPTAALVAASPQPLLDARVTARQLRTAYADGATLVLANVHRTLQSMTALARGAEWATRAFCSVNLYVSPPRAKGFVTHFDEHDVLAMQLQGSKTWHVYERLTMTPRNAAVGHSSGPQFDSWEATFTDMPGLLFSVTLRPGDVLYLPRGTPHHCTTGDSHSAHATIAVTTDPFSVQALLHLVVDPLTASVGPHVSPLPAFRADPSGQLVEALVRRQLLPVSASAGRRNEGATDATRQDSGGGSDRFHDDTNRWWVDMHVSASELLTHALASLAEREDSTGAALRTAVFPCAYYAHAGDGSACSAFIATAVEAAMRTLIVEVSASPPLLLRDAARRAFRHRAGELARRRGGSDAHAQGFGRPMTGADIDALAATELDLSDSDLSFVRQALRDSARAFDIRGNNGLDLDIALQHLRMRYQAAGLVEATGQLTSVGCVMQWDSAPLSSAVSRGGAAERSTVLPRPLTPVELQRLSLRRFEGAEVEFVQRAEYDQHGRRSETDDVVIYCGGTRAEPTRYPGYWMAAQAVRDVGGFNSLRAQPRWTSTSDPGTFVPDAGSAGEREPERLRSALPPATVFSVGDVLDELQRQVTRAGRGAIRGHESMVRDLVVDLVVCGALEVVGGCQLQQA